MGLEVASFIDGLVTTNPVGATDPVSEGDNHLRLIKTVLKATFPGLAGAGFRVQDKAGNYTVAVTDNISLIRCTATLTLTLTAAATLGNQHVFYVYNDSRGIITIDPNSGETINGQRLAYVLPDQLAIVFCNGTSFFTLEDTQTHVNPIYNSGMEIWQQWGSSSATVSAGQRIYGPDGFLMDVTGVSSQVVMFRGTNVPSVGASQIFVNNSLEVQNKVAKAAYSASTHTQIEHQMEGHVYQSIAQRPFWFSFWVHSSLTGTYNISFKNGSRDQSYVDWFTITAANTLEYKTFLISPPPSAGTWNYSSGTGLIAAIVLGASATQVARQSWTAVDAYIATANVNWNAAISASFGIVAPHINLGSRPTLWKNYGVPYELNRAQRYFSRSQNFDYGRLDSSSTDGIFHTIGTSGGSAGNNGFLSIPTNFVVPMRVEPIISLAGTQGVGSTAGATGQINLNSVAESATVSADFISIAGFSIIRNLSSTNYQEGFLASFNYIADARL